MKELTYDQFIEQHILVKEFETVNSDELMQECYQADKENRFFTLMVDDNEDAWFLVKSWSNNAARFIITEKPYTGETPLSILYD